MNNIDITSIEDSVKTILRGLKVSENIYSNRPKASENSSDFVVVMVSGGAEDLASYSECVVSIHLFAKDVNSFKNGKKLSIMQRKICEGFPADYGRLLFDIYPTTFGDIPDDFGFHRRTIRIQTTIKII